MSQQLSPLQQAALDQAQAVSDRLQMRHTLSDALTKSVIEAAEIWAQVAADPGNPQTAAARHWLGRLAAVMEQAQATRAGIHLVARIPGGSNGRAERSDAG